MCVHVSVYVSVYVRGKGFGLEMNRISRNGDDIFTIIIITTMIRDWCNLYKRENFLYMDLSVSIKKTFYDIFYKLH